MEFAPEITSELKLDDRIFRFGAHPILQKEPYCQEGRASMVYQIVSDQDKRALKVFKLMHRKPSLVSLSEKLADYASIPGLSVCSRTVMTPAKHEALLRQHKDLIYSIIMPWIDGPTWFDVLVEDRVLTRKQCLEVALALCHTLTSMEQRGLAHCDLSGPNLILSCLNNNPNGSSSHAIQLVDVEGLYSNGLTRPDILVSGTYPHIENITSGVGEWSDRADRFAGGVLIAEILGWCDERTRAYIHSSHKDMFFSAEELQEKNEGFTTLLVALQDQWGQDISELFERVWKSKSLSQCPTFGEWSLALPTEVVERPFVDGGYHSSPSLPSEQGQSSTEQILTVLMDLAQRLNDQGNKVGAIAAYNQVLSLTPPNSSLHAAVRMIIRSIEETSKADSSKGDNILDKIKPLDLTDIPRGEWNPVIPERSSRHRQLVLTAVAFVVVAILLAVGVLFFGQRIVNNLFGQTVSGTGLSLAIGLIQAWLFRKRVRKQKFVLFILSSLIGGIIGGMTGGLLLSNQMITNFILGGIMGAIAGGITAAGQNLLMRSQSTAKVWLFWNIISWCVIWSIGWLISWGSYASGLDGNASTAIASVTIMVLTGIALSIFLNFSPDIEF